MWGTEGLTCGYDGGDRVAPDEYADEFRFTGTLKRVTLDLSGELIQDTESRSEDRHGAPIDWRGSRCVYGSLSGHWSVRSSWPGREYTIR